MRRRLAAVASPHPRALYELPVSAEHASTQSFSMRRRKLCMHVGLVYHMNCPACTVRCSLSSPIVDVTRDRAVHQRHHEAPFISDVEGRPTPV